MRVILVLAVASLALLGGSSGHASRASGYAPLYVQVFTINYAIWQIGLTYRGRHVDVENASCLGLARYGIWRGASPNENAYWRFRCEARSSNGAFYSVAVSTTRGPSAAGCLNWHEVSIRRGL